MGRLGREREIGGRRAALWGLSLLLCFSPLLAQAEYTSPFQVQPENAPPLEAHFLSVKAADCTLLINDGHAMLVDSGNPSEAWIVLDYLADLGIEALDAIFLTHPHADHVGGFLEILQVIPVDVCYMPANFVDAAAPYMNQFRALLEENLIPIIPLKTGDSFTLGRAKLTAYQWEKPAASYNNQSMILHVLYGERAILLGADIENHAQRALGLRWGDALKADVLKVPHHGQNLVMQEFHDAVQPTLAIITNVAGEVQPQIALFKRRGLDWYTTVHGTVVVKTDGLEWEATQLERNEAGGIGP